jgi:hypothetical protein
VITAYVSIGNSDDKLTQARWSQFVSDTSVAVRDYAMAVHGAWLSEPASMFQNACWCLEVEDEDLADFKVALSDTARFYEQDWIALAIVDRTEFL